MLDAVELMPDGDPVEKASVMFDKMDDDGSGELTEDEFIKVSQIGTMNLGLSVIVYNTQGCMAEASLMDLLNRLFTAITGEGLPKEEGEDDDMDVEDIE